MYMYVYGSIYMCVCMCMHKYMLIVDEVYILWVVQNLETLC